MHPVYIDKPLRKKRGRQPPAHGRPYECMWCYEPAKLVGHRLCCTRQGCEWGYELKVWNEATSSTSSRS